MGMHSELDKEGGADASADHVVWSVDAILESLWAHISANASIITEKKRKNVFCG